MVFGAGLGLRMRPLTNNTPKPLLNVHGKPIIEYSIDALVEHGVETIVVNSHYLPEQIKDFCKNYKKAEIIVSNESDLLDTGGGIKYALPHFNLQEACFVINGDIIWEPKFKSTELLKQMEASWRADAKALLVLKNAKNAFGYSGAGDFDVTKAGLVKRNADGKHQYVFTGVQLLDLNIVKDIQASAFSITRDVYFTHKLDDGSLDGIYGIEMQGEWYHIGDPEALDQANKKSELFSYFDLATH